jgi:DNA-binding FadR family transcriptional regulator
MSSDAMKWARRQRIQDGLLSAVVKQLAQYSSPTGSSWRSQSTLATDCGISDRSARFALKVLQHLGVLTRGRRSAGKNGRLTDFVQLALHRDFDLERTAIQKAREQCRRSLQPERRSFATGTSFQGITYEQQKPFQKGEQDQARLAPATGSTVIPFVASGGRR